MSAELELLFNTGPVKHYSFSFKEAGKATPSSVAVSSVSKLTYTVREVAETTGLSERKIWDLVKDKTLGSRMLGGRRLVLAESLNLFLKGE